MHQRAVISQGDYKENNKGLYGKSARIVLKIINESTQRKNRFSQVPAKCYFKKYKTKNQKHIIELDNSCYITLKCIFVVLPDMCGHFLDNLHNYFSIL